MTHIKLLSLCVCFCFLSKSRAQQLPTLRISLDSNQLHVFRDTIFDFAFDSLTCNMVNMSPINTRVTKKFKYLGNDMVFIKYPWTNDPHYICNYPNMPLLKGKIYTFDICFAFMNSEGPFNKFMGFNLSNDIVIWMYFFGSVAKKE